MFVYINDSSQPKGKLYKGATLTGLKFHTGDFTSSPTSIIFAKFFTYVKKTIEYTAISYLVQSHQVKSRKSVVYTNLTSISLVEK